MSDAGKCLLDGPFHQYSDYWSYNQPGWQPPCDRCGKRGPAKKYNSTEPGQFAGRWICASCVTPDDTLTPYYLG